MPEEFENDFENQMFLRNLPQFGTYGIESNIILYSSLSLVVGIIFNIVGILVGLTLLKFTNRWIKDGIKKKK